MMYFGISEPVAQMKPEYSVQIWNQNYPRQQETNQMVPQGCFCRIECLGKKNKPQSFRFKKMACGSIYLVALR